MSRSTLRRTSSSAKVRQPFKLILGVAVLNRDVLALDIAELTRTLAGTTPLTLLCRAPESENERAPSQPILRYFCRLLRSGVRAKRKKHGAERKTRNFFLHMLLYCLIDLDALVT